MKSFIVKNTWSTGGNHGWGNGYVAIPPTSSWHGVEYHEIPIAPVMGLSWSSKPQELRDRGVDIPDSISDDDWIVGFDTVYQFQWQERETDVRSHLDFVTHDLESLELTPYVADDPIVTIRCPECKELNDVSDFFDYGRYEAEVRAKKCDHCCSHFYFSI